MNLLLQVILLAQGCFCAAVSASEKEEDKPVEIVDCPFGIAKEDFFKISRWNRNKWIMNSLSFSIYEIAQVSKAGSPSGNDGNGEASLDGGFVHLDLEETVNNNVEPVNDGASTSVEPVNDGASTSAEVVNDGASTSAEPANDGASAPADTNLQQLRNIKEIMLKDLVVFARRSELVSKAEYGPLNLYIGMPINTMSAGKKYSFSIRCTNEGFDSANHGCLFTVRARNELDSQCIKKEDSGVPGTVIYSFKGCESKLSEILFRVTYSGPIDFVDITAPVPIVDNEDAEARTVTLSNNSLNGNVEVEMLLPVDSVVLDLYPRTVITPRYINLRTTRDIIGKAAYTPVDLTDDQLERLCTARHLNKLRVKTVATPVTSLLGEVMPMRNNSSEKSKARRRYETKLAFLLNEFLISGIMEQIPLDKANRGTGLGISRVESISRADKPYSTMALYVLMYCSGCTDVEDLKTTTPVFESMQSIFEVYGSELLQLLHKSLTPSDKSLLEEIASDDLSNDESDAKTKKGTSHEADATEESGSKPTRKRKNILAWAAAGSVCVAVVVLVIIYAI